MPQQRQRAPLYYWKTQWSTSPTSQLPPPFNWAKQVLKPSNCLPFKPDGINSWRAIKQSIHSILRRNMKAPLSKCVHTYTPTLRDQSNGRKCSINSSSGLSVCRHSGHSHSMSTGQTSVACAVLELSWSYKLQQAAIINKESWRLASWLRPSLCVTSSSFPTALSKRKSHQKPYALTTLKEKSDCLPCPALGICMDLP